MSALELLSAVLLLGGAVLGISGGVGLLRFPDFYTRLHAAGVTDTLCAGMYLAGLALHFGWSLASVKLAMIFAFLLFTSPTACHVLARTARQSGLPPWSRAPGRERG